jgi:hypothetical protein
MDECSGRPDQASREANQASDGGKVDLVMRKVHILGLAMFAVLAFSVVSTAVASAETALWLANGNEITAPILAETAGELLLENVIPLIGTIDILCSGIFDGFVSSEGKDEVTEVLNLSGVAEKPLNCTVHSSTNSSLCAENELANVEPINLPWLSQLELSTEAAFTDDLGSGSKLPGYKVECVTTKSKNTCEGLIFGTSTNNTGGVLQVSLLEEAKTCELGKGFSEGEGEVTISSGGPLSVSEP